MFLAIVYRYYKKASLCKPRGEQTAITHDRMVGGSISILIAIVTDKYIPWKCEDANR